MKSTFALNIEKGTVELSHGAGGRASAQLIEEVFAKHFTNEWLDEGHDGALLPAIRRPVAVSCDAHVVSPLFFPGGDIGKLAVCGTVNDVAMCGAHPLYLTASFIIEEGFALADLERIVKSMAQAAKEAGVAIVTGDTKVVERGKADGVFICTSGIGEQFENTETVSGKRAQPGDVVLVSGAIGDHGTAILSRRQGLTFLTDLESDCAPLNKMVEAIMKASSHVHVLRDPTRGGLAATLNEIATQSKVGIELNESAIVVHEAVNAACEFLGLDPLYVANEGKLIAICPEEEAQAVLEAMRTDPRGKEAAIVGRVTEDNAGYVEMVTTVGGRRAVDWLNAEQLPRIC
ncbi:MAG: hydrogenase expression/formation protein HypE [Sutterella sp.]|nr:hydrogenase expression/formation protein HypE [Sutterella sp.]